MYIILISSFENEFDLFYLYHRDGHTGQDSAISFQSSSSVKRVNLFSPLAHKAGSGSGGCIFGATPQRGQHLEDLYELKGKKKPNLVLIY